MSSDTTSEGLSTLALPAFLERVAGPDATPGGGSVAALAGALAAALVRMVGGLTADKKGYEAELGRMEALTADAAALGRALQHGVEEDAKAYLRVMAAYRLPRTTESEKTVRSASIQGALREAAETPLRIATQCRQTAELALTALQHGNKNAGSDAAAAVLVALTGLEAALLNVATNLDSIKDVDYVTSTRRELMALSAAAKDLRDRMWQIAHDRIASLPPREP